MIELSDLQGHWVRDWIKAPGFEDHTTSVHWMQAGCLYADVRVPLERPDLGEAACLADVSAGALYNLAKAEGFAGHVTLEGNRCTWHRDVNWHGEPEGADVGEIAFDDEGRMIETGVLAQYAEQWVQNASADPCATPFSNGDYSGVLILDGDVGILGIGHGSKPSTQPVLDALAGGTVPDNIATLFDGMHALCRRQNDEVIATLGTNPLVEGSRILSLGTDAVTWHKTGFDGSRMDVEMPIEKVSL